MKRTKLMWTCLAGVGAMSLAACSKTAPTEPTPPAEPDAAVAIEADAAPVVPVLADVAEPEPDPEPEPEPAPDVAPAPSFTVAEWGVLIYDAEGGELTSGLPVAAVAPPDDTPAPQPPPVKPPVVEPPDEMPPVARKPVIYLRPGADWDLGTEIKVTVDMAGEGRLHEVWPTPANGPQPTHGASFSWTVSGVKSGACEAGWAPAVTDAPCSSLVKPTGCEAADLELWVPTSAVCLDVGGTRAPALLYNGFPSDRKAPLVSAAGFLNTSKHAIGPVFVVNADDASRVHRIETIAPTKTEGPGEASEDRTALLASVSAELLKRGLSADEAADFMRAWTPLLKDEKGWVAFGFLDTAAIEAISTLSIVPAPAAVHRVMAFAIVE